MPQESRPSAIVRDTLRFRRFYPDAKAVLPPDAEGPGDWSPTCVLIDARIKALQAADRARHRA